MASCGIPHGELGKTVSGLQSPGSNRCLRYTKAVAGLRSAIGSAFIGRDDELGPLDQAECRLMLAELLVLWKYNEMIKWLL